MASAELIAKKYPNVDEPTIDAWVYASGLLASGIQGNNDPLNGFLETARLGVRMDYPMFLVSWADIALSEANTNKAWPLIKRAVEIVNSNDPCQSVKEIYRAKLVDELGNKYSQFRNDLTRLSLSLQRKE